MDVESTTSSRVRSFLSLELFSLAVPDDPSFAVGGKGTLVRSIRSTRPGGNVWVIGCVRSFSKPYWRLTNLSQLHE